MQAVSQLPRIETLLHKASRMYRWSEISSTVFLGDDHFCINRVPNYCVHRILKLPVF